MDSEGIPWNSHYQISRDGERHCRHQQVKGSSAALKCGQMRGGTPPILYQQHVSSSSVSSLSSSENVCPVGPPTDDDIMGFIKQKLAHSGTVLTQKTKDYGYPNKASDRKVYSLQSDRTMPEVDLLPTTSVSDKEDVAGLSHSKAETGQYTAPFGQALTEDGSKSSGAKSKQKSKETENQQIMRKVPTTCTKNEDESQVLHPSKHLDGIGQVPDDREGRITEQANRDTALKPVDAVELDNVQCMTDLSEDHQTKSASVVSENKVFEFKSAIENQEASPKKDKNIGDQQHCIFTSKEAIAHSKLTSSLDEIQIHNVVSISTNSSERLSNLISLGDAGCMNLPTDLSIAQPASIALPETEAEEHVPPSEREGEEELSMNTVKQSVYEDISDDEHPYTEHKEVSCPAHSEDLVYEDISEDESPQIEYIAGEMSSLTQASEPIVELSPFEDDAYGLVQGQASMKTEITSNEELVLQNQPPPKTEILYITQCSKTDTSCEGLLCPKDDSGSQENHSVSCSPSSVSTDEDETEDEMDDGWFFIPVDVSDLKFEADDDHMDSLQENALDVGETRDQEGQCDPNPTLWPSTYPEAFSPVEVFDTLETFQQVTAVEFKAVLELPSGSSTPEHETDSEGEPHTPKNRRESVDSSETEDSINYSPASERNIMTVSKKLLKSSAPLPSETDVFVSAKEDECSEVTHMPKGQTSSEKSRILEGLRQKVQANPKHAQTKTKEHKISKQDEIVTSRSDMKDQSDQNSNTIAKGKSFFSSSSDDDVDAENWGQRIKTKAPSEHVQHNRQNSSNEELIEIIIIDSDSEDDNGQNYKKPSRKRSLFTGLGSYDASCVKERRQSPITVVSDSGTDEETIQETRLSSADPSPPQHRSKFHDTKVQDVMQDACSDLSQSLRRSGQLIGAKGSSEHGDHKNNRQRMSKRRAVFHDSDKVVKKSKFFNKTANTEGFLTSRSEYSGDDVSTTKNRTSSEIVDSLCRTGRAQPQKTRLSPEDSEKQTLSADEETDPIVGPNPLNSRLFVAEPSQPAKNLKLLNESRVHKQGKNGTLPPKTTTASSPKTDSLSSKSQPANNRHHVKDNDVQANISKSKVVSRQLSLPGQKGPSTSLNNLPSTSRQPSEARCSLAVSRALSHPGENVAFAPRHLSSSELQPANSNPSTINRPCTISKGPSSFGTKPLSTREQVIKDWKEGYHPTRRDRKPNLGMEEYSSTSNTLSREARPGPRHRRRARQRRPSYETAARWVKQSKTEAIQRTVDIRRESTVKPSLPGEGYKWRSANKSNESWRIELD
ncbi:uncharacterized protein LOC121961207 isoform X2 [Plectropomus leopardus]|uniref:uncharacterized protein LOC121961207 isoform X2 n=1 Tax=Plectropomus leopardus TaxID=160734 RepID=UPI001C4D7DD1|nr:uncharacterized protein LOC121961207 isoform X2 [Plectropomus leopardus]